MALKTKPSDWLEEKHGHAWAKLILERKQIDLSKQGGYATSGFVDFRRSVLLVDSNQFLMVASEYPHPAKSDDLIYRYKLIRLRRSGIDGETLIEIEEPKLYEATYQALKEQVIPVDRRKAAVGNWLYMAAVYMWYELDPAKQAIMPMELAKKIADRAEGKLRRRIEYLDEPRKVSTFKPQPNVKELKPPMPPPPEPASKPAFDFVAATATATPESLLDLLIEEGEDSKPPVAKLHDDNALFKGFDDFGESKQAGADFIKRRQRKA